MSSPSGLGFSIISNYEKNGFFFKKIKEFENIILKLIQVTFKQYLQFMNYINHDKAKIYKWQF